MTDNSGSMAMPDWPLRPWLLGLLLCIAGLTVHLLLDDGRDDVPWRVALAVLAFFGAVSFAFTVERIKIASAAIFSAVAGIAMGGLAWRYTVAGDYPGDAPFWFAAGIVAVIIAVPLFQAGSQAGFHRDRLNTSYKIMHFYVWSDIISGGGALAFVGLSWALIAILAALFALLEISFLQDLMSKDWFGWMFSGAAFGAGLGVLRNQLKVLGTLQSVVLMVLSILAVPLAAALILFLAAMLVSGPEVLWNATDSATPILLACAAGAFILVNSVLRDADGDMTTSSVLRIAAFVLAAAIAPLAIFAAVSMGVRIAQHGLSPERIWGLISIIGAVIYGTAYLLSMVRGGKDRWRGHLRQANLHMAFFVCGAAIILALPLFDFGAVSTRSQLARLASGEVSEENFDMAALRWDFGDAGRAAVRRLAASDNAALARRAKTALVQEYRPYQEPFESVDTAKKRLANLRMQFDDPALRERVALQVAGQEYSCSSVCVALDMGTQGGTEHRIALIHNSNVQYLFIDPLTPLDSGGNTPAIEPALDRPAENRELKANSRVEIREWTGRRIYIDGKPIGEPIE